MIRGEVCTESMAWLEKSLVGEFFSAMDFLTPSSELRGIWSGSCDTKELSSFTVLISFLSSKDGSSALDAGLDPGSSFYFDIRPWNFSYWSFSRKVWLECNGIPPNAWSV